MRFKGHREAGFTILEVTCAIVILAVGLMGVAAMQTKAVQGNAFAASYVASSLSAQEWMEWLVNFVNRSDQEYIECSGKLNRINYCRIMDLDVSDVDDQATEIEIPDTMEDLLQMLSDKGFTNPEGTSFTAEQIPGPPGAGYRMVWRVLANRPIQDTTTIEIRTTCANAFSANRSALLRFIVSSAM